MTTSKKDHHQLNSFFKNEYKDLKRYVRSRISESAERDADDIIQDVALKLFSRNSGSPINNITGFVYGAIKNKIVDIMRTKKQTTPLHDEPEENVVDLMDWLYNKADNSHSERMKHELKMALADLKPDYRDVILAIDFQRLTYREYALEIGVPEGTLMSRRHRALSILNKKLEYKKNINL